MSKQGSTFNVIGQLAILRRYARSLVRDAEEAEDLVHDALVKAYERQATFRTGGNLRAWLMSILHNTHIDRVRSKRSETRRMEAIADISDGSRPANQELSVRLAQVQSAFFDLPEDQRAALHLVAIEELSYEEAAQALGIPVGTLMSRISRARAKLRNFEDDKPAERTTPRLRLIGGSDDGHA